MTLNIHEGIKGSICENKAGLKSDLKIHMKSVHEQNKPSKCNICDYETVCKSELESHIESDHERIKQVKYNICDYETF